MPASVRVRCSCAGCFRRPRAARKACAEARLIRSRRARKRRLRIRNAFLQLSIQRSRAGDRKGGGRLCHAARVAITRALSGRSSRRERVRRSRPNRQRRPPRYARKGSRGAAPGAARSTEATDKASAKLERIQKKPSCPGTSPRSLPTAVQAVRVPWMRFNLSSCLPSTSVFAHRK